MTNPITDRAGGIGLEEQEQGVSQVQNDRSPLDVGPLPHAIPKARPILFSGAMIRAQLDGRKTQTRRIIKPQPDSVERFGRLVPYRRVAPPPEMPSAIHREPIPCPYGVPGDVLYARETWSFVGQQGIWELHQARPDTCRPIYRADGQTADRWWPSIHMPRWASRLTLEITDVRVEHLQDISEADADAEGFGGDFPEQVMPDVFPAREGGWGHLSIPECYGMLWEHINGPGSWDANPWVWAVSFRVHQQNVDAFLKAKEAA